MTIRKSIDCIIAAVALQHQCDFLHNDRDFEMIAKHFPLQLIRVSCSKTDCAAAV